MKCNGWDVLWCGRDVLLCGWDVVFCGCVRMRCRLVWMKCSFSRIICNLVWMRGSFVWIRCSIVWMWCGIVWMVHTVGHYVAHPCWATVRTVPSKRPRGFRSFIFKSYITGLAWCFLPVMRIRDNLVWIRIRRYVPLTNWLVSGSGSCYFRQRPSGGQQKLFFFKVFLLITFWSYIYIIFQK